MSIEISNSLGYGRSDKRTVTFEATQTTSTKVDFNRPYSFYVIRCEDCTNIADSTLLSIGVSVEPNQTMTDLYEINDSGTKWSKSIPTTGTFQFMLNHAFGSQVLELRLSNAAAGTVNFMIYGFDPVITRPS